MSKHQFDDCDIKVDHKKEELQIIVLLFLNKNKVLLFFDLI